MNNAAGVDISKGKSTVSVLRPFGEVVAKPFTVGHTGSELRQLADYLKSLDGETRVVMEHTGRYYEPVAHWDPTLAAYLAKKRAEGKHYNVALSHAAKKLVRLIYAMEKPGQPYQTRTAA